MVEEVDLSFEDAIEALEEKVNLIEEGKLSPEETRKTIDEGIRLAKMAIAKLDEIRVTKR
jgi:exodeoxyribonuclease VII small subunit